MPKIAACVPVILLGAALFAGSGALAQSGLRHSKKCSANDGGWSAPGGVPATGRITMDNDGGWCGQRLAVENNSLVFGGAMHVSKHPAHGEVSIVKHDNGTDVFYKPNAGYTGSDSFSVLVELFNIDKPYNVVVR